MLFDIIKISLISFIFYTLGEPGMLFDWYQKIIRNLPEMIWKPLGGCLKCFSGQFALWYYLIAYWQQYNFINHIAFVSAAIFISLIYHTIYIILNYLINKYDT